MMTSMLTLCAGMALMTDPQASTEPVPAAATAHVAKQAAAMPGPQVHSVNKPVTKTVSYQFFKTELEVVANTNVERARHGLPALELCPNLTKTARQHTWWMTRNQNLQHGNYPVAENIAMGQNSSHEVVRSWMNSSGHRANILNRGHRRIGVAAYTTPNGTTYWCQQFTQ